MPPLYNNVFYPLPAHFLQKNKHPPFSKWDAVFTDDQMAAAMIDRLAHHGHLVVFEGESYRMKQMHTDEKSWYL
jgi:DNA replication protein DnaC